MTRLYAAITITFFLLCITKSAFSQQIPVSGFQKRELSTLATQSNAGYAAAHNKALALAKTYGWIIRRKTKNGGLISLQGVNSLGFPVYLKTDNNTTAAATTGTNTVQPGGAAGLNLSGSSTFLNDKLAIWDGGSVLKTHQEFAG
ncbi:MAG: hypothetical protein ACXVJD_18585, partial [Mucilaginibacter sp.]